MLEMHAVFLSNVRTDKLTDKITQLLAVNSPLQNQAMRFPLGGSFVMEPFKWLTNDPDILVHPT